MILLFGRWGRDGVGAEGLSKEEKKKKKENAP